MDQFTGEFQMCLFQFVCVCVFSIFLSLGALFLWPSLCFMDFFALDCTRVVHTKKGHITENERLRRIHTPTKRKKRNKKLTNTYVARVFPVSQTITWVSVLNNNRTWTSDTSRVAMRWNRCDVRYYAKNCAPTEPLQSRQYASAYQQTSTTPHLINRHTENSFYWIAHITDK